MKVFFESINKDSKEFKDVDGPKVETSRQVHCFEEKINKDKKDPRFTSQPPSFKGG